MRTTFPISSTRDIVSKLPIGGVREIIEPSTVKRRCVETQYLTHLNLKI